MVKGLKKQEKGSRNQIKEKSRGITLIALVITIIVLLILAGVSMATLTGDNGILNKAKLAKEVAEQKQEEEKMDLEKLESEILKNIEGWNGDIAESFAKGDGTEQNPFEISKASEMAYFAKAVNDGNAFVGQYIEIVHTINLSGHEWIGIEGPGFEGHLEGNHNIIYGATMQDEKKMRPGIFGTNKGTIQNLVLSSIQMKGIEHAGGLVGANQGEIRNIQLDKKCIVETAAPTEKAYSGRYSGGIAGRNEGNIVDCINYGKVITRESRAGGIVGQNTKGSIINCKNYGEVGFEYANVIGQYNESGFAVGGIVGYLHHGEIQECKNYGKVVGGNSVGGITGNQKTSDTSIKRCSNEGKVVSKYREDIRNTGIAVGGIVGVQWAGTLSDNSNKGEIIAEYQSAGGIVGVQKTGTIERCSNEGKVVSKYRENFSNSGEFSGGIVGIQNNGTLSDSNNKGEIIAEQTLSGGISGRSTGVIQNCYNIGTVKQISTIIGDYTVTNKSGGISGDNMGGTIRNCYNVGNIESADATNIIDEIGGIVGLNRNSGTIQYCYNQGELKGGNVQGGIVGQLYDGTLEKNYYYLENYDRGIGHNGTSYAEITLGSDIANQAEKITKNEANSIIDFDTFYNWINTKI